MTDSVRFDKPTIFKCVICGNEYPAIERDADWNWKMPELIEFVEYKGERQLRCIPKIHEELLYTAAKVFDDIASAEPRNNRKPIEEG